MMRPMTRYRPERTADGEGGYEQSFDNGKRFYGATSFDDTEQVLLFKAPADIAASDVIEAPGGEYYRVVRVIGHTGAGKARARIERMERPINA